MKHNFAITGASGYIAPRHLKAIRETGNNLIAACDPHDSVGVLDGFFKDVRFFTEFERFDRHIEKLRRLNGDTAVNYISICSPNYLHDAHCRFALRVGADAICEKPLVLNPWNIDALKEIEDETGHKIYTVLQLRVHPTLLALKKKIEQIPPGHKHDVRLTYITSRGPWYLVSWKGQPERSGGLATNIGVHFFDLFMWLFDGVQSNKVHHASPTKSGGFLELKNARVQWFLSIDAEDLPAEAVENSQSTYRSITVDGEEIEFSGGFSDLHTVIYKNTLEGNGFGLDAARPSIELVHNIRVAEPSGVTTDSHPFLRILH
ncbi:MAG: Gfo/Idh/MocA family oxidoreductase [bacterium]|nr:Gfo/Idh/MocA family oxidoreductase [bacterium]